MRHFQDCIGTLGSLYLPECGRRPPRPRLVVLLAEGPPLLHESEPASPKSTDLRPPHTASIAPYPAGPLGNSTQAILASRAGLGTRPVGLLPTLDSKQHQVLPLLLSSLFLFSISFLLFFLCKHIVFLILHQTHQVQTQAASGHHGSCFASTRSCSRTTASC
jgi:hypothetical protein